ncbi:hypothetical protein [Zhongshania sp.]|uniref:hypothetical protein n=1 Tax=Zhongshania sp. TaxID=1971902 RepID=UPI0035624694
MALTDERIEKLERDLHTSEYKRKALYNLISKLKEKAEEMTFFTRVDAQRTGDVVASTIRDAMTLNYIPVKYTKAHVDHAVLDDDSVVYILSFETKFDTF